MSKLSQAAQSAAKAAKDAFGPGKFKAGGSDLECPHCTNSVFEHTGQLGGPMNSFASTMLTCSNCGLVQWFAKTPERV